jgi:hypothetical protein
MRERWARRIAFLTGLLVLLLAATFAITQNVSTTGWRRHAPHPTNDNDER